MKIEIVANGHDNRSDIIVDGKTIYTNWNYDFAPWTLPEIFKKINPNAEVTFTQGFIFSEDEEIN